MGRKVPWCFCILIVGSVIQGRAVAAVTSNAETVLVRRDCSGIQNCFTSIKLLVDWIDTQRFPNQDNPLVVDIGAGRFQGPFQCLDHSGITLRGAGRGSTVIYGDKSFIPGNVLFAPGMNLRNCDRLNVSDLRVEGDYGAVWWDGTGSTIWMNVDLVGGGRGWYETANCDGSVTRHAWFGSRIVANPYVTSSVAYSSFCGEAVFHGSELAAYGDSIGKNGLVWGDLRALWVQGGDAKVYGGVLQSIATIPPASSRAVLEVVRARSGSAFLSNTSIHVSVAFDFPVKVLRAESGGTIEAVQTSYRFSGGGQPFIRIDAAGGAIAAPFDWGASASPPNIISVTGADSYTETGCDDAGCRLPGARPHPMVYDNQCLTMGPWFDVLTSRCRGE